MAHHLNQSKRIPVEGVIGIVMKIMDGKFLFSQIVSKSIHIKEFFLNARDQVIYLYLVVPTFCGCGCDGGER